MSILEAIEPTWPPLRRSFLGSLILRAGDGGGKRVSAASQAGEDLPDAALIGEAERAMRHMGQLPLFSLTAQQNSLDRLLSLRGYNRVDPTRLYRCDISTLTRQTVPRLTTFEIWEPLAVMEDIWAEGGIGPARCRVMQRVRCPHISILGRADSKPAGAVFVAAHEGTAMLHALEVRPTFRRKGLARWMVIAAAHWAQAQKCHTLGLAVTEANVAANALYAAMGFEALPGYHYRMLKPAAKTNGPGGTG